MANENKVLEFWGIEYFTRNIKLSGNSVVELVERVGGDATGIKYRLNELLQTIFAEKKRLGGGDEDGQGDGTGDTAA